MPRTLYVQSALPRLVALECVNESPVFSFELRLFGHGLLVTQRIDWPGVLITGLDQDENRALILNQVQAPVTVELGAGQSLDEIEFDAERFNVEATHDDDGDIATVLLTGELRVYGEHLRADMKISIGGFEELPADDPADNKEKLGRCLKDGVLSIPFRATFRILPFKKD